MTTSKKTMIWDPVNHLNLISDESLKKALYLVKNNYIQDVKVSPSVDDSESFNLKCKYSLDCGENHCFCKLNQLKKEKNTIDTEINRTELAEICDEPSCLEENCILYIAIYIFYLRQIGKYNEILSERKHYLSKFPVAKGTYNFEWNPPDGLKYIPRPIYQCAKKIVDHDLVLIGATPDSSEGVETFNVYFQLTEGCENCKGNFQEVDAFMESYVDGTIELNECFSLETTQPICGCFDACNCKSSACPYLVAAYIKYCREMGLEEKIKRDRQYYHAHLDETFYGVDNFQFELDNDYITQIKDYIRGTSDNILNTALYIIDEHLISLFPKYNSKRECYTLVMSFTYQDNDETSFLRGIQEKNGYQTVFIESLIPDDQIDFITSVMALAGAIDYMRRKKIDFSDAIAGRHQLKEDFKEKASNIAGLEKILQLAKNPRANSLYCIIEGARFSGKYEVIKQISSVLGQNCKLNSPQYIKMSFEHAINEQTQTDTFSYTYDERDYNIIRSFESLHHEKFKENQLYVLDGLDEFVSDYKAFSQDLTQEKKNKGVLYLAHLLGRFYKNTYIIIVSQDEKTTNAFLELDNNFKFLYKNNVIKFPNNSLEDLYYKYLGSLSDDVAKQISEPEKFKHQFLEYITFNEKFLPFWNTELTDYLSNFSNIEGHPVLPPSIYDERKTQFSLNEIVGMEHIKKQIKEFEAFITFQKRAQANGIKISHGNLHMQFLGNPGTGKTTIARIIANMLFDIGILKENKVVEVERKDLIGQYSGETAQKTSKKINEAMGGVLFIDEAYSLFLHEDDSCGKEAIATLIKAMEDFKDSLVVIFAGYDKEMGEFLNANSGIESRIGYTFHFENYTPEELTTIFKMSMDKQGFLYTNKALDEVQELCKIFSRRKNFGNGRFVKKIEQQTLIKHACNAKNENWLLNKITSVDIPLKTELLTQTSISSHDIKIDDIVGLETVKKQLGKFKTRLDFQQKAKKFKINIANGNNHMLFLGNPGTGKTTIARIIRQELFETGVISENKMIECSRKDLIGEYLGQTAPKTQKVIDQAMGGILFIDEAYALYEEATNGDMYGSEAIMTLIKAMEDNREDFVVIFAGYKKEMQQFLNANSGISSRIGYTFEFEDYSAEELTEIFRRKITSSGFKCNDKKVLEKVKDVMQYFTAVPNFGNGRFSERLSKLVYEIHAERCQELDNKEDIINIVLDDIPSVEYILEHIPDGKSMIKPSNINDEMLQRTAIHELGHAIACKIFTPSNAIKRITISAEGNGALGYVKYETSKQYTHSAKELRQEILILMAGIAAEEVFFKEYQNGGTSDLEKATSIAYLMITKYGMSNNGFIVKDKIDEKVQNEANTILKEEFENAKNLIIKYKDKLCLAKDYLLKNNTITDKEFSKFVEIEKE